MPIHDTSTRFSRFLGCIAPAFIGLLCVSAGCGDAAPGHEAPDPAPPGAEVGYLAGWVSGLAFETDTVAGVTDENGAFFYEPGQTVRFRLGDVVLGEAEGADFLSPFDLAGIEPITNGWEGTVAAGKSFHRVTSMLILLESFDYDGDATNGIEITDEVAALFEGVELDLENRAWIFRTDPRFREALNAANAGPLLADHRAPRGPAPAMNRLYADLHLDPGFHASRVVERDDGRDGVIDDRVEWEFDSNGFPSQVTEWSESDGGYENRYEIDDWGRIRSSFADVDADGVADSSRTVTMDRDGNATREESDHDGDGRADEIVERGHDAFGRTTSERRDRDADGTPDYVSLRTYDDETNSRVAREDFEGDGITDRITTNFYTADQRNARVETDHDADGRIDEIDVTRYDDLGRAVAYTSDINADGRIDSVESFEFDIDGRLFRKTRDYDNDGIADYVETNRYDGLGRQTSTETDSDADGAIDVLVRYQYVAADEYVPGATATVRERDNDNDGVADSISVSFFDENGVLLLRLEDHDGDASPEQSFIYRSVMVGWGYYFWD